MCWRFCLTDSSFCAIVCAGTTYVPVDFIQMTGTVSIGFSTT